MKVTPTTKKDDSGPTLAEGLVMLPFIYSFLPRIFLCSGCNLPTRDTVCESCLESRKWNNALLPSPVSNIEAIAPLLISYENTQRMLFRWKQTAGTDLKRALFGMSSGLKNTLLEKHLFAVVPIPQSFDRSLKRGHESAVEIAKFFARELDLPLIHLLDLKTVQTERQTGRSRFDRAFSENPFCLASDFLPNRAIRDELERRIYQDQEIRLLLVDDVLTTGTTLGHAASIVKELLPRSSCYAGALGYRPKRKVKPENPYQVKKEY